MKQNRPIRIIKRNNQSVAAETPAPKVEEQRSSAREAAGNVASWVKEFRQRRRPDPRRAFASLFGEQATPLNSLT
jgi:hypothetical protein